MRSRLALAGFVDVERPRPDIYMYRLAVSRVR